MTEIRDILRQSAAMIAEALGKGWRVDTDQDYYWQSTIFGPTDEVLYIAGHGTNAATITRLKISGGYNSLLDHHDQRPRNLEHVKITVSRERTPAAIAREIERRLLPKYREEIERVKVSVAADRTAKEAKEKSEALLLAVAGSSHVGYVDLAGSAYANYRVNYAGEAASLELRSVPIDLAVRIIELVRAEAG